MTHERQMTSADQSAERAGADGSTLTFIFAEDLLPCPCCGHQPKGRVYVKANPFTQRYVARCVIDCPCFLNIDIAMTCDMSESKSCFDAAEEIESEGRRRWNRRPDHVDRRG